MGSSRESASALRFKKHSASVLFRAAATASSDPRHHWQRDSVLPRSILGEIRAQACARPLARMRLRSSADRRMSIVLNEHFEEDGAAVYRAACQLGCEGIVKTPRLNLSPGPVAELDQSQKFERASGEAGGRGRLGQVGNLLRPIAFRLWHQRLNIPMCSAAQLKLRVRPRSFLFERQRVNRRLTTSRYLVGRLLGRWSGKTGSSGRLPAAVVRRTHAQQY